MGWGYCRHVMGSRYVLEAFRQEVARSKICSQSPVAVAVSGSCGSVALLWLAKQVFRKVVGITVDHGLQSMSAAEAARVGELATSLGVEHHIVNIDWQGSSTDYNEYKLQNIIRTKQYEVLLHFCMKHRLKALMTGHHKDSQIETMVFRLCRGNGIDALPGLYAWTLDAAYPEIEIIRPLLNCHKELLQGICHQEKMDLAEAPSNMSPHLYIRQVLAGDRDLAGDLEQVQHTLSRVRRDLNDIVFKAVRDCTRLNTKFGHMVLNKTKLLKMNLPRPVLRRTISALLKYTRGDLGPIPHSKLDGLLWQLPYLESNRLIMNCLVCPTEEPDLVIICRAKPRHSKMERIRVGEKLHWMKRWEIELVQTIESGDDNQYFVREFQNNDLACRIRGRKVLGDQLPPVNVRPSLPVIADKDGAVILIPQLENPHQRSVLISKVRFKPFPPLDLVINPYEPSVPITIS